MTDQKRDESRDAGVLWDKSTPLFERKHHVLAWNQCAGREGFSHYVPRSDLVAAEAKTEKLSEVIDMLLDEINTAPLSINGGKRDIDRFESALKLAREFAYEGTS